MFSKRRQNVLLAHKIKQLALPLAPLVQLSTGQAHPRFPTTLLQFHLLTEENLDSLAHFYHQSTPSLYTMHYPKPMNWRDGLGIEEKRRKLGLFIGLRGCESPVSLSSPRPSMSTESGLPMLLRVRSEEEIWDEAMTERESAGRKMSF